MRLSDLEKEGYEYDEDDYNPDFEGVSEENNGDWIDLDDDSPEIKSRDGEIPPPREKRTFRFEGGKFTPDTQPRDAQGRFRKVLARLKVDLGTVGASRALEKIEEIENLDFAGDYGKATEAAGDLISIIDRLDTKALNPDAIQNVRESSRELGEVMANLPFAFGEQAEKVRYSDLPPALRDLIEDMITRVEAKIGKEDADEATRELKSFMSGGDFYSQGDISSQMAKLLRLLT